MKHLWIDVYCNFFLKSYKTFKHFNKKEKCRMIQSDLLDKVYLAFQNLDGWQDSVLEFNVLDGYNGNLHLVASLDLETKNSSSYVKIDIEIFDENLNEYVVETQQIVYLDGDDTDVGLVLDFLQTQIECAM